MAEATKRFAVVTGTNKGIGLETVKQLASKARLFEGLGLSVIQLGSAQVNNAGIGGVKLDADAFIATEYSGGWVMHFEKGSF
ncbi:hypothetical protein Pyn_23710 [Prunus yedoensis var. nudiflora]|uniref:(+)-neomenthol dehydrogenase n=1 Tax=Prunus yedoensis var. nudiflora TaxID=2094558 RepID=A0A314Y340_PRUYE|nr:hypothetical protein Pyn_24097 [Prunus yedoensis var. nudiflora]PQQ10846.1 hypothetical protein Pyn_23710 [Prunus yedoensis var. nudiflora]